MGALLVLESVAGLMSGRAGRFPPAHGPGGCAPMPPSSPGNSLIHSNKRYPERVIWGLPVMRHIHLDDGLRLRFPGRSEDFDQGVEIGMIAVLMDQGLGEFSRWIARSNLSQV